METLEKNSTVSSPVTFTEGALKELHKLQHEINLEPGQGLRVGVKGGGCSGMSYLLAFDHKTEADQEYTIEGIPVIMNRAHTMYVLGMEIDYQDGLDARGFVFSNPNAKETCGCGTSFSA